MALKSKLYKSSYGAWAGHPEGTSPDYKRCCQEVWSKDAWSKGQQCVRPNGHGPENAYCKQHDPETVKTRYEEAKKRAHVKWNKARYEIHGRTFFDALLKIAEGHNDARDLAQKVIKKFKEGEYK